MKRWTLEERAFVLAHRDRMKLCAIARRLGRTTAAVVGMLCYHDLTQRKRRQRHQWEAETRRLHTLGLSDSASVGRWA